MGTCVQLIFCQLIYPKDSFEVQVGIKFDPSKLNANLVKNADGLLAKMSVDNDIEWVVKEKKKTTW